MSRGISLGTTDTENLGESFEKRRYRQLRREAVAPEIGRRALLNHDISSPRGMEQRRIDELKSGFVEALKGEVSTHYEFESVDGSIVAEDGEPVEEMLVRALRKDIKLASQDSFYEFLPLRTRAELDNFHFIQLMARGETAYNTVVEISPYAEELDTSPQHRAKLGRAGQQPEWGRSMIRVSHWDGQKLHIVTDSSDNFAAAETFERSADNSSVTLLKEAVKSSLGYTFKAENSTDMLSERIALNAPESSWRSISGGIVSEADTILARRHGGRWRHGRPAGEAIALREYVDSQTEVLSGILEVEKKLAATCESFEEYDDAFRRELYNASALLEKRLELGGLADKIEDYGAASAGAGATASAEGKSYNMCGLILSGTQSANESATAAKTGIESLRRLENKKIQCPECKKKVIVASGKLDKGILSCKECGHCVDICTGRTWRERVAKTSKEISAFDIIGSWWIKKKQEEEIQRIAEAKAAAERGKNVSYLEKKKYEQAVHRQLERQAA